MHDNLDKALIKEHDKRVGDGILKYFDDTFGSNPETSLPQPNYLQKSVSIDVIERGLKQIINLFLINGYAFSATPIQFFELIVQLLTVRHL